MIEPKNQAPSYAQGQYTRTWWGSRWQDIISADTPRHAKEAMQGDALFRRGAVTDLAIGAGTASARVVDRNQTVQVTLTLEVYDAAVWSRVAQVVAEQLRFTAALLRHQFPATLDDRLTAAGIALFPDLAALELTSATLGQGVNRHTVALHRALGARIDREPNVLFTLRGRDTQQLVRAVSSQRGETRDDAPDHVSMPLEQRAAALRQLVLHPRQVEDPAWLISRLDDPPPVALFGPIADAVTRAAQVAWRIAAGDGADTADTELLLAELRARRIGTADALATAIGHDADTVATALDALYDSGIVLRTGTPPNVKYRVAEQ